MLAWTLGYLFNIFFLFVGTIRLRSLSDPWWCAMAAVSGSYVSCRRSWRSISAWRQRGMLFLSVCFSLMNLAIIWTSACTRRSTNQVLDRWGQWTEVASLKLFVLCCRGFVLCARWLFHSHMNYVIQLIIFAFADNVPVIWRKARSSAWHADQHSLCDQRPAAGQTLPGSNSGHYVCLWLPRDVQTGTADSLH